MSNVSEPASAGKGIEHSTRVTVKDTEPDASSPNDIEMGHLAIRDDGAILLSTEDCGDRDLSERELVTCIVLRSHEVALAHRLALNGIAAGASRVGQQAPEEGYCRVGLRACAVGRLLFRYSRPCPDNGGFAL